MREGFSLSGGRIEDFVGAFGAALFVIPHAEEEQNLFFPSAPLRTLRDDILHSS